MMVLQKYKCKNPSELVGKTVILQAQTGGSGTEFLSFN